MIIALFGKRSLTSIFITIFVLQVFMTVGLTWYISFKSAQRSIAGMAGKLQHEVDDLIQTHVDNYLSSVAHLNKLNSDAMRLGLLSLKDSTTMERYFWSQGDLFEGLGTIAFSNEQGEIVAANRFQNYLVETKKMTERSITKYAADPQGHRIKIISQNQNYDARQRPWFKKAKKAGQPTWTEISTSITTSRLDVTAVSPFYDSSGHFKGVFFIDLSLSQMSEFLRQIKISPTGHTFIVERNGNLIAASNVERPFTVTKENMISRIYTPESAIPLISESMEYLFDNYNRLEQIQSSKQFSAILTSGLTYLQVTPYERDNGIDWLVVTAIPAVDFMTEPHANIIKTVYLFMVALLASMSIGVLIARWLARPISTLNIAAMKLSTGKWNQKLPVGGSREVRQLAESFKIMASKLQTMVRDLEQNVKERTQDLQESETRYRSLSNASLEAIIIHQSGDILDLNQATKRIFGYSRKELIGKSIFELVSQETRELVSERIGNELTGTYEVQGVRKDGSIFPVEIRTKYIPYQRNKVRVAIMRDITWYKAVENKLCSARDEAEAANRAKSAFLANMSHELRTPLNAIMGYTQVIKLESGLSDKVTSSLDIIHQGGHQLLTLINDILDLVKIDNGNLSLNIIVIDLKAFLNEIENIFIVRSQAKGLAFDFQTDPNVPTGIEVDASRLRQVLFKLLNNAVKFTDQGKVSFKVSCIDMQIHHPDARVCLQFIIEDTGPGISTTDQKRIFEPFEQAADTTQQAGASGLGLAIVKQMLSLMGSQISVESQPGNGSRFAFKLELPQVVAEEIKVKAPLLQPVGYYGPRRKVLVVIDVDYKRQLLFQMLKPLGFELIMASDGPKAVKLALTETPDLILMDLVMPGMDDAEVISIFRQHSELKHTVIITLSAGVTQQDQARNEIAGSNTFLSKPIELQGILKLLEQHMNLEWEYHSSKHVEPQLYRLPREVVEDLHRLTRLGNMREVRKKLDDLEKHYPESSSYICNLRNLVQRYKVNEFLTALK